MVSAVFVQVSYWNLRHLSCSLLPVVYNRHVCFWTDVEANMTTAMLWSSSLFPNNWSKRGHGMKHLFCIQLWYTNLRRKGLSDSSQSVLNSISRLFFFFSPSYLEIQIGYNLLRVSELHFILRSEFFFVHLPEARLSNKMDQLLPLLLLVFKYSYPLLFWLVMHSFQITF